MKFDEFAPRIPGIHRYSLKPGNRAVTLTVKVSLRKAPTRLNHPRIETPTHICTLGCARPLEDAMRMAFRPADLRSVSMRWWATTRLKIRLPRTPVAGALRHLPGQDARLRPQAGIIDSGAD